MPELPEVEVTKRGLTPLLLGRTVNQVNIYNPNLRYKRKTELDFNGKLILKESTLFSTPNVINYNKYSLHNEN